MTKFRNIFGVGSIIACAAIISACGNNNSCKPNGSTTSKVGMQVGNIGAIPTNKQALGNSYPLMVYNNSKTELYIDKITVSGLDSKIQSGNNDLNIIDKNGCTVIPSGGTCPIIIHSAALQNDKGGMNGQYALTISGHDIKNKYTQSQIIAYENYDPIIETQSSKSGIYYNPSNANNFNIKTTSNDGAIIPIYFDKAYNNVKILSGGLPVSLLNCGLPNSDNEYNIPAHSSCALSFNITGGKPSSNVIQIVANYTGDKSQLQNNQLKSNVSNNLSTNNVLVSLGVVNAISSAANVVSGVVNGIVYANGLSPQTVTFINTGASTSSSSAMSLVVNGTSYSFAALSSPSVVDSYGTTAQVTNDTCTGANIVPYSICSVTFVMNGVTGSGNAQVLMNYNTGSGSASTFFNNYYYSPGATASLVTTMSPTNMTNVALAYTSTATVTVQNPPSSTVNVTLNSNAQIFNPPANNVMTITQGSTPCTSGQVLTPGSSCSYQISYTPTEVGSGTAYTAISGTYPASVGSVPISSTYAFSYSSINPTDLLFNPTAISMNALVNNTVTMMESVTNNTSNTISDIVFDFNSIGESYVTLAFPGGSDCLSSLPAGQTCSVQFVYRPTGVESINNAMMTVTYSGGAYSQDTIQSTFVSTLGGVNIGASVSESQVSGPIAFTGNGTSATPVSFYNYGNSTRVLITYTNNGNQPANNFVIDASTAPSASVGYSLNTSYTTCPTGGTTGYTLAPNASCILAYDLSNPNYSTSFTTSIPMNFTIPTVNYIDNGSLLNTVMNTWSFNGNGQVYITSQPVLLPNTAFSPVGWLVADSVNTYYTWSAGFANSSSGSAIVANFNISSPIAGGTWSSTSGTVPGNGATINSTVGSGSTSSWYYNLPYSTTVNSQSMYTNWSYIGANGTMKATVSSTNQFANPATAYMYLAATGYIATASWIGNSGRVSTPTTPNTLPVIESPAYYMSVTTLGVNNYLTSIGFPTFVGIRLSSINVTLGRYNVAPASGGGNAQYSTLSLPNYSGFTAGPSLTLQSESGTAYYVSIESATGRFLIGTFTYLTIAQTESGTLSGTDGSAIYSVGTDNTNGNFFITTVNNNLYYCGNVFAATVGTCTNIALPTAVTTAAANSTIAGYSVVASGGQVIVNQVVTPTSASATLPSTVVAYGADNAATTNLSNNFTIDNMAGATPFVFNYNVGTVTATPKYSYGLHGSSLVYSSGNYTKTATVYGYSISNMSQLFSFATGATITGYTPAAIAISSMIPFGGYY